VICITALVPRHVETYISAGINAENCNNRDVREVEAVVKSATDRSSTPVFLCAPTKSTLRTQS
jgi:hypothetical protein